MQFASINLAVCTLILSFAYLGFGIANAYISANNSAAKHECGVAIWYCVTLLSALNFVAFIITVAVLCIIHVHAPNKSEKKKTNGYFGFLFLCLNVWACIAYFDISPECRQEYDKYPDLWNMLEADVMFFFANIGLVLWLIISTCVFVNF